MPLAETYGRFNPFLGVVLAGVFTEGSLQQLRSNNFSILYFPYESIVKAFSTVGIDASFDEDTADKELQRKVDAYSALKGPQKAKIPSELSKAHKAQLSEFLERLKESLTRELTKVYVATLHGPICEVSSVDDAVKFIQSYDETQAVKGFVRYEVNARYSNGDKIIGEFQDKSAAIAFLRGLWLANLGELSQ